MVKFSILIYTLAITLSRSCSDTRVRGRGRTTTEPSTAGECEVCVPYYLCDANRTNIIDGTGLLDIRKTGPCTNYLEVCCKSDDVTDEPITPITPTTSSCGQRNVYGVNSLRITGAQDNEAQFGEFPWMVAVTEMTGGGDSYLCGGSLLNPQVVLTAAHCVKGKTQLAVTAGEWDTQSTLEPLPIQKRQVREVLLHEQFNSGNLHNDVALLLLETPVDLKPNVGTICLPEQDEVMDNRRCVASGWGKDQFGKKGKYQKILKKVELPIVARGQCLKELHKTRLGEHFILDKSLICAGGVSGQDTCQGDGGGPLACPSSSDPQVYVQAGIVAGGIGCNNNIPGLYVNVAHFRNWMDNKLSAWNINTEA